MKPSRRFLVIGAALALALVLSACQPSSESGGEPFLRTGKPRVLTTNYPVTWMAERISGDAVEVIFPAPADGDPAYWKPSESDIAAYQSADLILRNGATYEKWADTVSLPESTQVDTSKGFAEKYIVTHNGPTHSHGASGAHSHDGVAFTTWIDLSQAIQQADAIRAALGGLLPDQKATFDANFATLRTELEALDGDLAHACQSFEGTPLIASHPIYQYLARRYGLKLRSVLWEPATVPDEAAMEDLAKILAAHPAKIMIWEGEPAAESVRKLEAIGVKSVVFDPCANRPTEGKDFLSVMKANLSNLRRAGP